MRRRMSLACFSLVLTSLCILPLVAAGCRRTIPSVAAIAVHQQITPLPLRIGKAMIAIQLADASAAPVSHAAITVEADMSHPGMAPLFDEAKEIALGSYQAHIDFNMGGDWVLLLHIKLANGQKTERRVDVGGVRSN